VKFITPGRAGDVDRTNETSTAYKMLVMKPLGESIRRWEDISKDFRDINCEKKRWLEVALHYVQSQALVLKAFSFQVLLP
jgi:hypothetical protein